MTVRPLRPAAPPDGGAGYRPVPKPRTAKPGPTNAPAGDAEPAGSVPQADTTAEPAKDAPADGRRRRSRFAHAVRTPPRQLAVGAARATRAWSRRPSGRTTMPGLFLLVLVAATAAAGALLVPAAIRKPQPVAVDATATAPASSVPEGGAVPGGPGLTPGPGGGTGDPMATLTPTPTSTGPVVGATGRPSDALAGWAQQVGQRAGIPVVAAQAYGYAELVLRQTKPSCQLSWTTLAAIGYVESRHGSANGATLRPDGVSAPEIVGPPLNGQGGTSRIPDSDQGQLDHDTVWDHAIGPMQFIPGTWQTVGADGDNDGVRNPHDIDDAALAAGNYLCQGGRNMSIAGDWWGAILSYNDVRRYAQDVFDRANDYGRLSRT